MSNKLPQSAIDRAAYERADRLRIIALRGRIGMLQAIADHHCQAIHYAVQMRELLAMRPHMDEKHITECDVVLRHMESEIRKSYEQNFGVTPPSWNAEFYERVAGLRD